MEKSYGIEAARPKLGEIADHARTTGEVIQLTRNGRTVAVVGPADAVRRGATIQVLVLFPDTEYTVPMFAVPRIGDAFEWTDDEGNDSFWRVDNVVWPVSKGGHSTPGVELTPAPPPGTIDHKEN